MSRIANLYDFGCSREATPTRPLTFNDGGGNGDAPNYGRRGPGRPTLNADIALKPKRDYKRRGSSERDDEKYRKERERNNLAVRLSREKKKQDEEALRNNVRLFLSV